MTKRAMRDLNLSTESLYRLAGTAIVVLGGNEFVAPLRRAAGGGSILGRPTGSRAH